MSSRPLVSVVVAAYNMSKYLPLAVRSVLDGTYPDVEILVVDDGSTDDTSAVMRQFADEPGFRAFERDFARRHGARAELVLEAHDPVAVGGAVRQVARHEKESEAPRAAAWKAMSDESTEWACPSLTQTFIPITGKPIRRPFSSICRKPFSTDAMYSVGMAPPRTSLTNSKASPSMIGSMYPATRPN